MVSRCFKFSPQKQIQENKTYPQGNAPINENQTENNHFTIYTQKFVLFWLGSVKVKDLQSVVLPFNTRPVLVDPRFLYHTRIGTR